MCKNTNKNNELDDTSSPFLNFAILIVFVLIIIIGGMIFGGNKKIQAVEKFNNSKPIVEETLKDSTKNGYVKQSDLIKLEEELSKATGIYVNYLDTTATSTPIKAGEEMFIEVKFEDNKIVATDISKLKK